jgi:hypothetical protein
MIILSRPSPKRLHDVPKGMEQVTIPVMYSFHAGAAGPKRSDGARKVSELSTSGSKILLLSCTILRSTIASSSFAFHSARAAALSAYTTSAGLSPGVLTPPRRLRCVGGSEKPMSIRRSRGMGCSGREPQIPQVHDAYTHSAGDVVLGDAVLLLRLRHDDCRNLSSATCLSA